jgi:hypothetical protein|tara:strand:- start:514 stop:858 length:345 start_codon:yes stop_codon:yes gene_type:complete
MDNDVVLLSDEVLIETRYFNNKKFKYTFVTAKRLREIFSNYDVEVVIVLRSQQSIIYSFYIEGYSMHERQSHLNTFNKHLDYSLKRRKNSELAMFYYDEVIDYYCSLFGKEKFI